MGHHHHANFSLLEENKTGGQSGYPQTASRVDNFLFQFFVFLLLCFKSTVYVFVPLGITAAKNEGLVLNIIAREIACD
jgi:hypothetical protein